MFDDSQGDESKGYENAPIYKKAMEIWDLAHRIAELAADNENHVGPGTKQEFLEDLAHFIIEDATQLAPKIAGAWGTQFYDIKMENAALIRKAAQDLLLNTRALEIHGFTDVEYCELLRNEIEKFRVLFAEWVKTFDPWDYIIDRWGLFNPPGVNYDDHDPDDDIPMDDYFDDFDEFDDYFDDDDDLDEDDLDD